MYVIFSGEWRSGDGHEDDFLKPAIILHNTSIRWHNRKWIYGWYILYKSFVYI